MSSYSRVYYPPPPNPRISSTETPAGHEANPYVTPQEKRWVSGRYDTTYGTSLSDAPPEYSVAPPAYSAAGPSQALYEAATQWQGKASGYAMLPEAGLEHRMNAYAAQPPAKSAEWMPATSSPYDTLSHVSSHPQRPPLEHVFSEPNIAPAHALQDMGPSLITPQYAHAQAYVEPSGYAGQDLLNKPVIPPRPLSAPPGQLELHTSAPAQMTADEGYDEKKSGFASRFVGNMLLVRGARSVVQSVASTGKLPFYLSPWGDNNPVVLPNVRWRDVALMGLATFGMDALAPGILELVGPVINHGIIMTTEQAAHHGIEHIAGNKKGPNSFVHHRTGVNTLQIRIKHKLMGEQALIRMTGERAAENYVNCAKGWFCPYLYATGRTPQLARGKDFAFAFLQGPGLAADASVAPTLLSAMESTPITSLCPIESPCATFARFRRLLLVFFGISPYRTGAWSQSRIPNEGRFSLHIISSVPAFVIPVKASTPVCGWSPWTLKQIIDQDGTGEFNPHGAYYEILNVLAENIDVEGISDLQQRNEWRAIASKAVWSMIESVQALRSVTEQMGGFLDLERTGFAAFRY